MSDPLRPTFDKIHNSLYLHTPSPSIGKTTSQDPDIILFMAWGNAPKKNILKYTTHYQTSYPNARILLFLTSFADMMLHTPERQAEPLSPAIKAIRAVLNGPKTLIHVCSNGGAYKLRELAAAFKRTTGKVMPFDLLVLDSSPGRPDFWRGIVAFKTQLPNFVLFYYIGAFCIYLMFATMFIFGIVTGHKPIVGRVWEDLNKPELIDIKGRRLYLFSKSDELIDWHDIEAHAMEAKQHGYEIKKDEFVGSRHVAHVVVDKVRYWKTITEAWNIGKPRTFKDE
ncbi:MAG: hypothetical protein GOMPHAMPRED_002472 [Gomphillus americanus]|uniref:Indole-diterpene biosynthesis protein PaxU n=1 Tax=Gomphillus americanus TaxID=1940652 RepID=A0A8H3FB23_9LECA|nr:MAG: hypothetical protein GOMPHAMPRED_002472 [Gomphillus americanus]